jgi:hypothetical protein
MPRRCSARDGRPPAPDDDTATEEAVAALSALDSEAGRTTDPVRMYMREMGTVELLTREGEIAIAKRIEEGLAQVQQALASFPWSVQLLLEEYDVHLDGKKRLAESCIGFADIESQPNRQIAALCRTRTPRSRTTATQARSPRTKRRPRPTPAPIRPKSRAHGTCCASCTPSSRRRTPSRPGDKPR